MYSEDETWDLFRFRISQLHHKIQHKSGRKTDSFHTRRLKLWQASLNAGIIRRRDDEKVDSDEGMGATAATIRGLLRHPSAIICRLSSFF